MPVSTVSMVLNPMSVTLTQPIPILPYSDYRKGLVFACAAGPGFVPVFTIEPKFGPLQADTQNTGIIVQGTQWVVVGDWQYGDIVRQNWYATGKNARISIWEWFELQKHADDSSIRTKQLIERAERETDVPSATFYREVLINSELVDLMQNIGKAKFGKNIGTCGTRKK